MAQKSVTLDTKPTATPLYRCVVDPSSDTTQYLIAYRAATLLPFADTVKDDNSKPNANIPSDPVDGTVSIRLGETVQFASTAPAITKNVQIHAEDLYIYTGSYFSFRERNLTITANRIFAVSPGSGASSSSQTIEFDCSGHPAKSYDQAANSGANGGDYPPPGVATNDARGWVAQVYPGADGSPGLPGHRGGDGGNITVLGDLKSLHSSPCALVLNVLGGLAGPGQNGGKGGRGGYAIDGNWRTALVNEGWPVDMGPYQLLISRGYLKVDRLQTINSFDSNAIILAGAKLIIERGTIQIPYIDSQGRWKDTADINIGTYIKDNVDRFYAWGGAGGDGGNAGDPGNSGSVLTSTSSDGHFDVAEPPPRVVTTNGGQAGHWGDLGGISAPYLLQCLHSVADWHYDTDTANNAAARAANPPKLAKAGASKQLNIRQAVHQKLQSAAVIRDTTELLMVLQRVKFEYQMGFGAQIYSDPNLAAPSNRVAKDAQDLKESLAWLQTCVNDLQNAQSSGKAPSTASGPSVDIFVMNANQFFNNLSSMMDIFGNAVNLVTNPAVSLSDANDEINSLQTLEDLNNSLSAEISDGKSALAHTSSTAQSLNDAIQTSENDKQQLIQQLSDTYDTYGSLRRQVLTKRDNLVYSLNDFWNKVKSDFDWKGDACAGWSGVMNSAGSVLMFAGSGAENPAYGIGAAASMGASIWNAVDSMDEVDREKAQKALEKNAIEKRVYRIGDDLDKLEVKDFLPVVREDDPTIPDPNAADSLQSTIMVDQKKFSDLCDRYFSDYIQSDDIQDMFNDFLDTVQNMKTTMQTYTSLAIKFLQAIKNGAMAQQSLELLAASNPLNAAPALDLVFQFYVRAVSEQFAAALTTLFGGVRAFNCMTMRPSESLAKLAELESFDNITGNELQETLDVLRNEIVQYLSHATANPRNLFKDQSFSITAATNPSVFSGFQKHRSLSLFILPKDTARYGLLDDWYDIRLEAVRVHLIGAKSASKNIVVRVTIGPRFYVMDEKLKQHLFEFPSPRTTSVAYTTGPGEGEFQETSSSSPMYETDFQFQINKESPENVPLATPFTSWKLSVSSSVDLSALTEIEIELDVYARTVQEVSFRANPPAPAASSKEVTPQAVKRLTSPKIPLPSKILIGARPAVLPKWTWKIGQRIRFSIRANLPFKTSDARSSTYLMQAVRKIWGPRTTNTFNTPISLNNLRNFRAAGKDIKTTTENMIKDPNLRQAVIVPAAQATYNELLDEQARLPPTADIRGSGFRFDRGHEGIFAGILKMDPVVIKKLMDDPMGTAMALWQSFPSPGVIAFNLEDSQAMIKAGSYSDWINKNPASLQRASKSRVEGLGCVIRLIDDMFVVVKQLTVTPVKEGDVVTGLYLSAQVVTSPEHALDGLNEWGALSDYRNPDQIMVINHLSGQNKVRPSDLLNVTVGGELMDVVRQSFPHALKAIALGRDVNEYIQEVDPELFKRRARFFFLDGVVGKFGTLLHTIFGPNTIVDAGVYDVTKALEEAIRNNTDVDFDNLPKTDQPEGAFVVDDANPGVAIPAFSASAMAGGFDGQPDLPPDTLQALTSSIRDVASEISVSDVRDGVAAAVAEHAPVVISDIKAEGLMPTTDNVADRLYTVPGFAESVMSTIARVSMSEDTINYIKDTISFGTDVADTLRTTVVEGTAFNVTTGDLADVTNAWVRSEALKLVAPELASTDIDKVIADALSKKQSLSDALDKLVAERKAMGDNDPDAKKLDQAIADAQKELDEAEDKQQQLQNDAEKAKKTKADPDGSRDDLNSQEQDELNKWKDIQSGERPADGGEEGE